jgi:hypothetical protein
MLNPAQCPEHALMARIPLGLGPSLHQLIEAFQLGAVILVFLSIGAWQNGYCTYQTDEDET